MNRVIICGRLVRDPDIRTTQAGNPMARMTMAVDRYTKKGEEKKADFPSLVAFGYTAEFVEKYLSKGTKILVEGRLQTGSYEKDGQTHYTTDIVCERIEFAESKGAGRKEDDGGEYAKQEDIPF